MDTLGCKWWSNISTISYHFHTYYECPVIFSQSNKMLVFYSTIFFSTFKDHWKVAFLNVLYTKVSRAKEVCTVVCLFLWNWQSKQMLLLLFFEQKRTVDKSTTTDDRKKWKITFTNGAATLWQKRVAVIFTINILHFFCALFCLNRLKFGLEWIFPKAERNIYHSTNWTHKIISLYFFVYVCDFVVFGISFE